MSNNSGNILGQDVKIKSGNITNNSGYITANDLNIVGNITGNVKVEYSTNEYDIDGDDGYYRIKYITCKCADYLKVRLDKILA